MSFCYQVAVSEMQFRYHRLPAMRSLFPVLIAVGTQGLAPCGAGQSTVGFEVENVMCKRLPVLFFMACLTLACAAPAASATEGKPEAGDPGASQSRPALAPSHEPATRPARVRYVWRINNGDKISDAFRAWARQARKWHVVWEAPELIAQATVDVDGSFEDAVAKVVEALNRGDANLLARFYLDSANGVLRVMEKK